MQIPIEFQVHTKCITYNQSLYIEDTMDGFCMQQTTFPYVCSIIDDASTDGEQEVIRNYLDKYFIFEDSISIKHDCSYGKVLFAQHKNNKNCHFLVVFLKDNHYKYEDCTEKKESYLREWIGNVPYVAYCEGDDYWIDAQKLQIQYDFLETNKDFTLIGSNGIILYTDTNKGLAYFNNHFIQREVFFEELVKKWTFPTASMFVRASVLAYYPSWHREIHYGDDVIMMTAATHGRVATIGKIQTVYRKGCGITKDLDRQIIYMCEQHKLFYTHLLGDTGDRYRIILEKKIKGYDEDIRFYKIKEKSIFISFFIYPRRTMKVVLSPIVQIVRRVVNRK